MTAQEQIKANDAIIREIEIMKSIICDRDERIAIKPTFIFIHPDFFFGDEVLEEMIK